MTLVTPSVDELTESFDRLECEGLHHELGNWGHVPSQDASYLVRMPCGRIYQCCAGRVAEFARVQRGRIKGAAGLCWCSGVGGCGDVHPVAAITWTDLL